MNTQQRPWTDRLAKIRGDQPRPYEEPDFAPDPTDPELLEEIMEAEERKMIGEFWELIDDDAELDDHGNPIVKRGPRPWAERLRKASPGSSLGGTVQAFLRQPFSSILLGASLCAGQPYLLWNIQTFLHTYLSDNKAWLRCGYGVLLNRLRSSNGTVVRDATTMDVLFQMAVEPFALMNQ